MRDDGGWDGSRGTFKPENAFTAQGMLVLAIDNENERLFEEDEYFEIERQEDDYFHYGEEEDRACSIAGMTAMGSLLLTTILTA